MSYPVARVGSIVQVGLSQGKVITGASSHFVDGGGAVAAGGDGVAPNVATLESVAMETEDMTPAQKRTYLSNRFGSATADSLMRATTPSSEDPGAQPVSPMNANSAPVSCDGFTNDTSDSTQISKYFTVADLSSNIYQPANSHPIPTTTALGNSRADTICNLKYLATNSIDPFQDWLAANGGGYTFKIGSGFRNNTNTSDHNIGSAADLHIFDSNGQRISREALRQLAITVVNSANIPYTQFLLEYTGGSSMGWIHLANRKSGVVSALKVGYTFTGSSPYLANLPRSA